MSTRPSSAPPPRRLVLATLTTEEADSLADHLASLGDPLPGVTADHGTATAFAQTWQRRTGATLLLYERQRLYRLGALTSPEPLPEGQGGVAGERGGEQLMCSHREFDDAIGEVPSTEASSWADTHIANERVRL